MTIQSEADNQNFALAAGHANSFSKCWQPLQTINTQIFWRKQNEENAGDESQGSHGEACIQTHSHRQAWTNVEIRIIASQTRGDAASLMSCVYSLRRMKPSRHT